MAQVHVSASRTTACARLHRASSRAALPHHPRMVAHIAHMPLPCSATYLPQCSVHSDCPGVCRYLNIRMLRNPTLYGVPLGQIDADPLLKVCPRPTLHCAP